MPGRPPSSRLIAQRGLRRLKTLPVAPTLLTAGNLASGITAILCAAHNQLEIGAILIFVAMICDMFDGKVARMTKQDGPFGAELDSLSDVVSFGVAPAILVHRLVMGEPGVFDHGMRILWFLTVFYPVMAAIRLARYNVEQAQPPMEQESHDTPHFRGIPSPGAAAVVASLIILHQYHAAVLHSPITMKGYAGLESLDAFRWGLLGMMTAMALLMVSTIRFPHIGNTLFGRMGTGRLILVLGGVIFLVWQPPITLAVITVSYVLYGVAAAAWRAFGRLRLGQDPIDDDEDAAAEDIGLGESGQTHHPQGPAPGR